MNEIVWLFLNDCGSKVTINMASLARIFHLMILGLVVVCLSLEIVNAAEESMCESIVREQEDGISQSVNASTAGVFNPGTMPLLQGMIIAIAFGAFAVFLAHGFNIIRVHIYEDKVCWICCNGKTDAHGCYKFTGVRKLLFSVDILFCF